MICDGHVHTLGHEQAANVLAALDRIGLERICLLSPPWLEDADAQRRGLSFIDDGGTWTLEFTRGNVLDFRPSQVLRINALTGVATCIEVDLTQVPDAVLGVSRPPSGTVSR